MNNDGYHTLTVSFPNPVFPPVTIATKPVKSGIWSVDQVGVGGKCWATNWWRDVREGSTMATTRRFFG
jgi:hypothetical protein